MFQWYTLNPTDSLWIDSAVKWADSHCEDQKVFRRQRFISTVVKIAMVDLRSYWHLYCVESLKPPILSFFGSNLNYKIFFFYIFSHGLFIFKCYIYNEYFDATTLIGTTLIELISDVEWVCSCRSFVEQKKEVSNRKLKLEWSEEVRQHLYIIVIHNLWMCRECLNVTVLPQLSMEIELKTTQYKRADLRIYNVTILFVLLEISTLKVPLAITIQHSHCKIHRC